MALLHLRNITLGHGGKPLLENANLTIGSGDRTCLIGRNGVGKSTLFKLIGGEIETDGGTIVRQQTVRAIRLTQEVPEDFTGTTFEQVAEGLGEVGQTLIAYEQIIHSLANDSSPENLKRLERIQHTLEANNGWTAHQRVEKVLSQMTLNGETDVSNLSGGMKRRVLLAKALVTEPDILLLDEPTNHLDINSIIWLEEFLLNYNKTLIFITHDRAFLQTVATRIIEIENGALFNWPCNYETYLTRKEEALAVRATEDALFDKKLAQEEVWIRQGIKARRTRNEGRVRALEKLRAQRQERRSAISNVTLADQQSKKSGKLVFVAENVNFQYGNKTIIKDLSTSIMRGDKIGIIGPNGSGKTTLINLILNNIQPDSGKIEHGTNISIAYFDQHRSALDDTKTIIENVSGGSDTVTIDGKPRHIMSYLQDFLFSPGRARGPISALSGGERNRLLLAKLFTQPANVLVMDEPTNDLDIETLELLEEKLTNYTGTLLLISHDRAFINNIVSSTLVMEGNGKIGEYIGGYDDWIRQTHTNKIRIESKPKKENTPKEENKTKKMSYKDQRELDDLPKKIETLEKEIEGVQKIMLDPDFYQSGKDNISVVSQKLEKKQKELDTAYAKWEKLDSV